MSKFSNFKLSFENQTHRIVFLIYLVLLSLYFSFITYLSHCRLFSVINKVPAKLLIFFVLFIGIACLLMLVSNVTDRRFRHFVRAEEKKSMEYWVGGVTFLISLFLLFVALGACKPGAVNYDVSNQWQQAQTGEYNNWHPVFHTLWIWLLTRFSTNYTYIVAVQLIIFSFAVARLALLLYRGNVPFWLVWAVFALVVASKSVRNTMMYPSKDAMMTILCVITACFMMEIILSKGKWLQKGLHAVLLGATLAAISLVRQNGMFFVIPLFILLILIVKNKRKLLPALIAAIFVIGFIKGVVYPSLDIIYPDNTTEESIGIPMTVIADVYSQYPEKLDEETRAFIHSLAPDDVWKDKYILHQYNSIKFEFPRELIKEKSIAEILRFAWRTAKRCPSVAFESVLKVTGLVWSIDGENCGYQKVVNAGTLKGVTPEKGKIQSVCQKLTKTYDFIGDFGPVAYLTQNIGVEMALLLLCGLCSVRRNGNQMLLLVLPIVCYNLATMLMLCGNDARFFHFSMVLSIPFSVYLLFAQKESSEADAI